MKKNIIIVAIIIAGVFVIINFDLIGNFSKLGKNKEFIEIKDIKNYPPNNLKVISEYDTFNEYFKSSKITKSSFKKNNFILLIIDDPECTTTDVSPIKYNFDNNKLVVDVEYNDGCVCFANSSDYYLLKVDKNVKIDDIEYKFIEINKDTCN